MRPITLPKNVIARRKLFTATDSLSIRLPSSFAFSSLLPEPSLSNYTQGWIDLLPVLASIYANPTRNSQGISLWLFEAPEA